MFEAGISQWLTFAWLRSVRRDRQFEVMPDVMPEVMPDVMPDVVRSHDVRSHAFEIMIDLSKYF